MTVRPQRKLQFNHYAVGFDGAILFRDILIVPHAMGQKLEFLPERDRGYPKAS